MKKLFSGKFLIILASSIVVLILLGIGAFYLFDDDDDVFIKSGYVLNPLSTSSEKYYFEENTGYRENLSSMIEFKDKDENTVSVLKDSFLHYEDGSLSFLKNGAILDLDSVNGNKAVSFYNISSELLFQKKDGGFVIETSSGDVRLDNFIGRISDNKYIVVGKLNLKMSGNDTVVNGNFFEIVYVEEGIINIENEDVKYQVAAENTSISVDNKVIDFGDKTISVDGTDLMSITAITIDGDENIELIPKGNEEEEENDEDENDGTGVGEGQEGGLGEGDEENPIERPLITDIVVTLKSYETKSTSIKVEFDIQGTKEDDSFRLQVVNLESGRSVDVPVHVLEANTPITIEALSQNTNYLFTVINNKDDGKYFQKIIKTDSFGIKFEKAYATSNSLGYNVTIDENSDVNNAVISLYWFNEDEDVMAYQLVEKKPLSSLNGNFKDIEFKNGGEGLKSNTIYTAVLDGIAVGKNEYGETYQITLTSLTLKQTPDYSKMTTVENKGASSYELSLGGIDDPDNSITKYSYLIYNESDRNVEDAKHIAMQESNNASPVSFEFGTNKEQLNPGKNYYFKAVVEYFDNEKYVDFITEGSMRFNMDVGAYVTVSEEESETTHNYFKANISIADAGCLISMPEREECSASKSPVTITVTEVLYGTDLATREPFTRVFENVVFDYENGLLNTFIEVEGLEPGTTYDVSVKTIFEDNSQLVEISPSSESKRLITTKDLASFQADWDGKPTQATEANVINASVKLIPLPPNNNQISSEESLLEINKVVIKLYDGVVSASQLNSTPVIVQPKEITGDIKTKFFDESYPLLSKDTFGLDMQLLKEKSKNKQISDYYTISIEAYTKNNKKIDLQKSIYTYPVPEFLRAEIKEPKITVSPIYRNSEDRTEDLFKRLNNNKIVGYEIKAEFDSEGLGGYRATHANFLVYSVDKTPLKFYIKDENGKINKEPVLSASVPLEDNEKTSFKIYMDYGTIYELGVLEEIMTRGNDFYVGFNLSCIKEEGDIPVELPRTDDDMMPSGVYQLMENASKDIPKVVNYISKNTENSVTYKYKIEDPDNALYVNGESSKQSAIYANVNDSGEKSFEKSNDKDMSLFTINNLRKGDTYKLYYYTILKKNSAYAEEPVVPSSTPIRGNTQDGTVLFDGIYNAKDYDFTFTIPAGEKATNRVTIKINARDELLNKIVGYRINFKDQKKNVYTLNENDSWNLSECADGSGKRCIYVKYDDLKPMMSDKDKNEQNWITVTVEALYDNGYSGFDYKVGLGTTNDHTYCILQTGNYEYISLTKALTLETWNEKLLVPKGYYTCSYNSTTNKFNYTPQLVLAGVDGGNVYNDGLTLIDGMGDNGYKVNGNNATPKMVSVEKMGCYGTNCAQFYFDTIPPKISVSKYVPILNGSKVTLKLTGIDRKEVDIKKEKDGKSYLYVEVWERLNEAGATDENGNIIKDLLARPTVKVPLNENPLEAVVAEIDGLKSYDEATGAGKYYIKVYANMKIKGEEIYQELYSEDYTNELKTKTYTINSLPPGDVFKRVKYTSDPTDVSKATEEEKLKHFIMSDTKYGNRTLDAVAEFVRADFSEDIKFKYVLCESTGDCTTTKNITVRDGTIKDLKMDIKIDLSKENLGIDIEYGKKYKIFVYAIAPYYKNAYQTKPDDTQDILVSTQNYSLEFNKLDEPKFEVVRKAKIIQNGDTKDYVVDLTITPDDYYQTFIGNSNNEGQNGKYFVKFQDMAKNTVGTMQLLDNDGNVVKNIPNYENYPLDAYEKPLNVRIRGLKANSEYTVTVYTDAFLNNAGVDSKIVRISTPPYAVYSSNDYGLAIGDKVIYEANEDDLTITFVGGSNFEDVVRINYTIQRVEADLLNNPNHKIEGSFDVGEEPDKLHPTFNEYWQFILKPNNYIELFAPEVYDENKKDHNIAVSIVISLDVKDKDGNITTITKEQIKEFEADAVYKIKTIKTKK